MLRFARGKVSALARSAFSKLATGNRGLESRVHTPGNVGELGEVGVLLHSGKIGVALGLASLRR